jgi:hypothetical protein
MPQPKVHSSHAERQAAYRRRCAAARERQLKEKGLPSLPSISTIPGTNRWRQAIQSATDLLGSVVTEMEEYFDDRSEPWQDGDRGERFHECLDAVTDARDAVADLTIP